MDDDNNIFGGDDTASGRYQNNAFSNFNRSYQDDQRQRMMAQMLQSQSNIANNPGAGTKNGWVGAAAQSAIQGYMMRQRMQALRAGGMSPNTPSPTPLNNASSPSTFGGVTGTNNVGGVSSFNGGVPTADAYGAGSGWGAVNPNTPDIPSFGSGTAGMGD